MNDADAAAWPKFVAVGDSALLVEFGTSIDEATHLRVLALDAALVAAAPPGMTELVPSYAALLIHYDPLETDAAAITAAAAACATTAGSAALVPATHVVPVCYDGDDAADLLAAAAALGLAPEELIARHLAAEYRVFMYGFAPGYAYLGGVPASLHLPRKAEAVRSRPVGSVMIAGGQCLVTTLPMPTGWWVIGRSPLHILLPEAARPFLFDPGDRIRFRRIAAADLR